MEIVGYPEREGKKMYRLIRKHNKFHWVENSRETGSDTIIKSFFSPKWFGSTWQVLSRTEKKTWIEFIESGQVNNPRFNEKIVQSWRRSQQAKVDPHRGICEKFLSQQELEKRSQRLVDLATPIMDNLYHSVKGSGFIIVLADMDGYVLRTMGELTELRQADKIKFVPGANWGEEFVGTNAIGTALALKYPVQITGPEHYCESHQQWTCSAAPIRKQDGKVIGFLDISGPRELANEHQLALIVAAVHVIEDRIVLNESCSKLYEINKYLEAVLNSVSDGIISVNAQGIITGLNKVAAKTLNLHPKEVMGHPLTASVYHKNRLQNFFKTRSAGMVKDEIRIKMPCGQGSFVATANPVSSDNHDNMGFVLTLPSTNHPALSKVKTENASPCFRFVDIIGESHAIGQAIKKAKRVAPGPSTVLILGKSGTGKELFAQAIHAASDFRNGPFVAVNCGAIPKELIQSELFGYVDGAFTGAKRGGCIGKFEAANGGTLFLDEIGEMPLTMQINLLRVLEVNAITPVGGKKAVAINVRIIAATNKSLFEEVAKGRFREDLYYRLNVVSISLPSLKDREGDIRLLVHHWTDKISRKLGRNLKQIEPDVIHLLENFHWPGNIRELINALESSINLMTGDTLTIKDLPAYLRQEPFETSKISEQRIMTLDDQIKESIKDALVFYEGNISKTAKALGIGRNTLYDKIKKYNIK